MQDANKFLWPPNSPDLNPVDYRVWGLIHEHVYKAPLCDTSNLDQRLIDTIGKHITKCHRKLITRLFYVTNK